MPEYIGPVQDAVMAIVAGIPQAAFGALPAFVEVGKVRRAVLNAPCVWVEVVGSGFNPEGTLTDEVHQFRLIVGVTGSTPDEAAGYAIEYVRIATEALVAADLAEFGGGTRRVFVAEHSYGALYSDGGGFGMFPEIALLVETTE